MLEPAREVVPRCLADEAAACYTSRMDKQKLLEWMVMMEALALCAFPKKMDETAIAYDNAIAARQAFAGDANCASLNDPPDTPPKILTHEVIDEIELGAREDERRVIVANLIDRAKYIRESLTTSEQADDARYCELHAAWIRDNVV